MPGHLLEISSNGPINWLRSTAHRTEVQAARVAQICPQGPISGLIERTKHLDEIHAAPQACWPSLVKRLIDSRWNVEQTNAAVKSVRKRQDEYAKECGVAKNTVTHWIQAAEVAAEVEVSQHTIAGPAAITQALSSPGGTGDPRDLMASPGGAPRRAGANPRVGPRDG